MRKLAYFFTNPFALADLSIAILIAFTTDLIQRMTANNPDGKLTARIDTLSVALAQLHADFVGDGIQLGIRKGVKLEKHRFRKALANKIRPLYYAAWNAFGDHSPQMREIFPKGRSILRDMRDDQVSDYLDIITSGIAEHEAELGPGVLAKAVTVRDDWAAVYAASESATGEKTATEAEKRGARANLERELFITIGTLITLFPDEPERFMLYMQQHLLGRERETEGAGFQVEVQRFFGPLSILV